MTADLSSTLIRSSEENNALTDSVIAGFTATIRLSPSDDERTEARLVMTEDQLRVVTDETTRAIDIDSIFDVVRDVPLVADADSTETVTLAFAAGSRRKTISIRTDAETLVRFQRLAYAQLLTGTEVAVERQQAGHETSGGRTCRLRVSAGRIRLMPTDGGTPIAVRRTDITRFDTPSETDAPSVVLYSSADRVERIGIRLPSFRLLNLFGRYLRADLLTAEALGSGGGDDDSIEVLLVDDDQYDRDLTTVFLSEQSDRLSITDVSSAAAALELLGDEDSDIECIVSDYKMPQMDGIAFLNAVREETRTLPFILYTGQGSERVAKQAILDDVTDYVEKDVGPEQYEILAERIEKAVR